MRWPIGLLVGIGLSFGGGITGQRWAVASPTSQASQQESTTHSTVSCPDTIETLTPLLLADLPSYANRVIQRSRRSAPVGLPDSYVLIAGRPEFEPLPLNAREYQPTSSGDDPKQIFFTTLERHYNNTIGSVQQNYHWVFLTHTVDGWRLALMFSRFGSDRNSQVLSPPRDSSQGVVAQAIRLWLRDCQVGQIPAARQHH